MSEPNDWIKCHRDVHRDLVYNARKEVRTQVIARLEKICLEWPDSTRMSRPYRDVAALIAELREVDRG